MQLNKSNYLYIIYQSQNKNQIVGIKMAYCHNSLPVHVSYISFLINYVLNSEQKNTR